MTEKQQMKLQMDKINQASIVINTEKSEVEVKVNEKNNKGGKK